MTAINCVLNAAILKVCMKLVLEELYCKLVLENFVMDLNNKLYCKTCIGKIIL